MDFKRSFLAAVVAMLPVLAQAHAHLHKSTPAANSSGPAPLHVVLEFNEAAQLTALTLQKDGATDVQKLGPLPAKPDKTVQVDAPKLDPGTYTLKWRAVGDDKHIVSGDVKFTVVAR